MKRVLVLAAVLALAGLAWGQEEAQAPNPLAGLEISAIIPDAIMVWTDTEVGVTWAEPVEVLAEGSIILRIHLKPISAPAPRRKLGASDWLAAGALAALAAAGGYCAGRLLPGR